MEGFCQDSYKSYTHYLPSADTGDCSDGVTVMLNEVADVPPINSMFTGTNPMVSDSVNLFCVNLTLITKISLLQQLNYICIILLVESMIVAVAIVIVPAIIPGEVAGTSNVIVNISSPSTMLSLITVMFTVLLLVPAVIVTVCVAELKSTLFPKAISSDRIYLGSYVPKYILTYTSKVLRVLSSY